MAGFKWIKQTYLASRMYDYFANVVKNYDDYVFDSDFFGVVGCSFDRAKAMDLIESVYTKAELKKIHLFGGDHIFTVLEGPLSNILHSLWNYGMDRRKCRLVLEAIHEYQTERYRAGRNDTAHARFLELARIMKLNDLEYEIGRADSSVPAATLKLAQRSQSDGAFLNGAPVPMKPFLQMLLKSGWRLMLASSGYRVA